MTLTLTLPQVIVIKSLQDQYDVSGNALLAMVSPWVVASQLVLWLLGVAGVSGWGHWVQEVRGMRAPAPPFAPPTLPAALHPATRNPAALALGWQERTALTLSPSRLPGATLVDCGPQAHCGKCTLRWV